MQCIMIMVSNWLFGLSFVLIWMVTAHVEACEMPPYPSPEYPAYPSHGDLRLCPHNNGWDHQLVMIYMGPDGTDIEHMWGTFSGTKYHKDAADTLCQQLGYDDGSIKHEDASEEAKGYPVWISGEIKCQNCPRHILRCNHSMSTTNDFNHEDDWYLKCRSFSTRLITESDYEANTYDGQVALIPPKGVINFNYSWSFGVVTVREKEKFWKYIWDNSSLFDFNGADTACRAMGYTHVVRNSVMTAKQHTIAYGDNYTFDTSSLASHLASRINCLESSPCIGCCDNFSFQAKSLATSDNAIVIRCSFYKSASHSFTSGGYKEICEITDNGFIRGKDVCPSGEPEVIFSEKTFIGIVTPLSILLIFFNAVTVALIIALSIVVYKWKHRGEYNGIPDENEGRPPLNER